MVRTKASAGCSSAAIRVSAAKAPRKNVGSSARPSSDFGSPAGKKDKSVGGNPVCARPTPDWQKPIRRFFTKMEKNNEVNITVQEKSPQRESPTHSHDDKENKNPKDEPGSSSYGPSGSKDVPSSSGVSSKKKRRILTISDSSDEEMATPDPLPSSSNMTEPTTSSSKVNGCVVTMGEEITTES